MSEHSREEGLTNIANLSNVAICGSIYLICSVICSGQALRDWHHEVAMGPTHPAIAFE